VKRHLWAAALLAVCAARPSPAQGVAATHRAAIEQLFAAMGAEREVAAGVEAEVRAVTARQPRMAEFEPVILAHTRRRLRWEDVRDDFVRAYARVYTEDEARQLAAFYRTPVGQKSLRVQPQLAADVRRILQSRLAAHRQELSDTIQARLRARGAAAPRPP
jgi:hypothetical protein